MSGLLAALRPAARAMAVSAVWRPAATSLRPALASSAIRFYGAAHGLSKQEIESRVLEVIKGFDKVDESKVLFPFERAFYLWICLLEVCTTLSWYYGNCC